MDSRLIELNRLYRAMKAAEKIDISSEDTGRLIHDLAIHSLRFLQDDCNLVNLKSLVPGKEYIAFAEKSSTAIVCRPANVALFNLNPDIVSSQWQAWWDGKLPQSDLARMSYSIALAPCLAMELFDRQNKKQPATYFECLVGHIFSRTTGQKPRKDMTFEVEGRTVRMTMDFLFDHEHHMPGIHLPVKMSTRERVVQAWAHQRLLDVAFGDGSYKGIMILFTETKLSSRTLEVIEICVPDQWLTYQALLSKMHRIYYFDVPNIYEQLAQRFPKIMPIRQFGDFFLEKETLFISKDA